MTIWANKPQEFTSESFICLKFYEGEPPDHYSHFLPLVYFRYIFARLNDQFFVPVSFEKLNIAMSPDEFIGRNQNHVRQ